MKKGLFLRFAALACIAILCLPALFACAPEADPLAATRFESLAITSNEKISANVTLSHADVEAHKGETAYLYELLPGETVGDLAKKDPIATSPIASRMHFEIDLFTEGHTRLYSSFSIYYQNGLPMFASPRMLDLAPSTASPAYLWMEDPKGLQISDVENAAALGLPHAMVEVRLASLLSEGDLPISFGGREYAVSSVTLAETDKLIGGAYRAGAQVSLRIIADGSTTDELSRTALLDFLASRYTKEENGIVTALYIDASAMTSRQITTFASTAHKALFSRISTGRIYILSPDSTVLGSRAFFEELGTLLSEVSPFAWGAAFSMPAIDVLTGESEDSLRMTPEDLSALTSHVKKQTSPPSYFALCDVSVNAYDTALQAANYAYVYALASKADMDAIFYGVESGDAYGLFAADGTRREIAEAFRTVDAGLSPDLLSICRAASAEIYAAVSAMEPSRRTLTGSANTGAGSGSSDYLFDFTTADTYGFSAVGAQPLPAGQANPIIHESGTHNESVLFAFLRHGMPQTGIKKLLSNGEALADATSLSIHALFNYADESVEKANVTLMLTGLDRNGEVVQYTSSVTATARTWQNVNFNVSSFVAAADLSSPVLLSLLCDSDAEAEADTRDFGLWVKCLRVHRPQSTDNSIVIVIAILAGVAIGFLLILFLYRRSHKRPKRSRRARTEIFIELNGGES